LKRSESRTEDLPAGQDLDPVFNDLELVESSIHSSLKLRGYFENPRVPFEEKVKVLKKFFKNYISSQAYDFIFYLVRGNALGTLTSIIRNYRRTRKSSGILEFEVRTTFPLSPDEKERLAEQFSAKLKQPLIIRNIVDPGIIAGMIITAGDIMIDASIRSKMKILAKQLRQG
jgi:F-type H+-transporting ATPase subunit delta